MSDTDAAPECAVAAGVAEQLPHVCEVAVQLRFELHTAKSKNPELP